MLQAEDMWVEERERQAVTQYLSLFESHDLSNPARFLSGLSDAVFQLSLIGKRMLPALVAALSHLDARVRVAAAYLVLAAHDKSPPLVKPEFRDAAVQVMVKEISQESLTERLFATAMLGMGGCVQREFIPALQRNLADADERLRVCSAAALAGIAAEIRLSDEGSASHAINLGVLLKLLENALRSGDPSLAEAAGISLARIGSHTAIAVEFLLKAFDTADALRRYSIVKALGSVAKPSKKLAAALVEMLDDHDLDDMVREAAAEALVRFTRPKQNAVSVVQQALGQGDWPVLYGSVNGFIRSRDIPDEIADMLCEMLRAEDADVRIMAANWLSMNSLAAARAVPVLMERLGKEVDKEAHRQLLNAIVAAGLAAVPQLIEAAKEGAVVIGPYAFAALLEIGVKAVPAITQTMLTDADGTIRACTVSLLHQLGPRAAEAAPVLLTLLETARKEDKEAIIIALSALGTEVPAVIPKLVEVLCGDDERLASWAKISLVRIGHAAMPALESAKKIASPLALICIEDVAGRMPKASSALPELLHAFHDDDTLELFAWIGFLISRWGPLSNRRLADILQGKVGQMKTDAVPRRLSGTDERDIRTMLEKMSSFFSQGRPLVIRKARSRKPGPLTPDGKAVLRAAQEYLAKRGRWHQEPMS